VFNVARTLGPALAGALIVLFGTGGTYGVQALLFSLAAIWTLQMRPEQRLKATADGKPLHRESFGQSIVQGCVFAWQNETVRAGLLTVMSASLFIVPFTTLLPVFARDILKVGATGQGFLFTAMGIGALCSAILIASAGEKLQRGILMLGAAALYGVTIMLFAASSWFPLSLLIMGITGLAHVHCNALVMTIIQTYSPTELRGRMTSLAQMSHLVMNAGSILIGMLASLLGARWGMASMGAAGTLAIITIFAAMPRARHIR
jgi:predicted MFS family arabinose efflux permease